MAENSRVPTILREAVVRQMTGLPKSTLYDMTRRGDFPAPVLLGSGRARGYLSDEIEAWIESRRERRSIVQKNPWRPERCQGVTP